MVCYQDAVYPFVNLNRIGVAIKQVRENQNHVGILFEEDSDGVEKNVRLIHLGFPKGMHIENPDPSFLWLDLGEEFDEIDREILLAHVFKIIEANIPKGQQDNYLFPYYGFDVDCKYFNSETGEFNHGTQPVGLTCATFVLEIFKSCAFELLDMSSWNVREDVEWQTNMIKKALHIGQKHCISVDQIPAQIKNIGNKRFLPEEVAASTLLGPHPLSRSQIKGKSFQIRKQLTSCSAL